MSPTSSKRKTNDPMGNKVLRTLGVDVSHSPKVPFGALAAVVAKPDTRLWWSSEHGPVHGKINPTQYRNRKCHCGSGLKFKHCCLNKKEAVDAVQGGGQKGNVEEGRDVACKAELQVGGERQEGGATSALEDGGVK